MKNLSKPYSIRLPIEVAEKFENVSKKTGIAISEILRTLLLGQDLTIKARQPKSVREDRKKAIFYLSKTSNNMNQIAKNLNILLKLGDIEKQKYDGYLRLLDTIDLKLKTLVDTVK